MSKKKAGRTGGRKPDNDKAVLNIEISRDHRDRLNQEAKTEGRTIRATIERMIDFFFANKGK